MKNKIMTVLLSVFAFAFAGIADVTISPTSRDFQVGGGGATVSTLGTGSWSATTDVDWIQLVKTSGTAGQACTYIVKVNPNADTRKGYITINGHIFTVTQQGCPVELSPQTMTIGRSGGSGSVVATMDAGVGWTAEASAEWIKVVPSSGTGTSTLSYEISPYDEVGSRTGTIRVGSDKLTITQTGVDVTLSPEITYVKNVANIVTVDVTALMGTSWNVQPNVLWLSVVDDGNGYGNSKVTIAVAENPSYLKRTGTVSIGSAALTIVQDATDTLSFSISPEETTASPKGAFGTVSVMATPDAPWKAESMDDWIRIAGDDHGAGSGALKYVTLPNPELQSRVGQVKFVPPVIVPDLDLYSGLLFWIKEQDNIEGNELRQTTYALSKSFDGSFSNPLKGANIPACESGAYTFSFSFKVGELDCINRIMKIGGHTINISADNVLHYQGLKTSFRVDKTDVFYTVVVNVDEEHRLRLYAGLRDSELACVWSGLISGYLTFNSPLGMGNFVLGYGTYPSTGNLQSGLISNIRFWTRALTEKECRNVDLKQNEMLESKPAGAPSGVKYHYFPMNGNMFGCNEEMSIPNNKNYNIISKGWTSCENRKRIKSRSLVSGSDGLITFSRFHDLFKPSSIITNGYYLKRTEPSWHYYYANPIDYVGSRDVTISMWVRIDNMPEDDEYVSLFSRKMSDYPIKADISGYSGEALHSRVKHFLNVETNNYLLSVAVNRQGNIKLTQTSCRTEQADWPDYNWGYKFVPGVSKEAILHSSLLREKKWVMITLVGRSETSITVFVDGNEIGNVVTDMTFGWLPPLNLSTLDSYENGRMDYESKVYVHHEFIFSIGGWVGGFDDFCIFRRVFSANEVKYLYEVDPCVQDVYHTVTQGIQEPTLDPSTINVEKTGGTKTVVFSCASSVNWQTRANVNWLSVVGDTSGTGSAEIMIKVEPNPTITTRTGTMTIGNKTLTIVQEGLDCVVSCEPTVFDTESSAGYITINPENNGAWTATTDVEWIYLIENSGIGNYELMFFVDYFVDTSTSRTGKIKIGEKTIYITQRGYELAVEPNGSEVAGSNGTGELWVDTDGIWNAIATAPWITIVTGYETGTKSGTVRFAYTENDTGVTRTGKIIISGVEYTLQQAARQEVGVVVSVSHGGTVDGGGNYSVGSQITLTATPEDGYEFSHWTGAIESTQNPLTVNVDAAKELTAVFSPLPIEISSVSSSEAGVALAWINLAWATKYTVYRGTTSEFADASTVSIMENNGSCSYLDSSGPVGMTCYYWIKAEGENDAVVSVPKTGKKLKPIIISPITYENLQGSSHTNPESYQEGALVSFTNPTGVIGYTFAGWTPSQITADMTGAQTVRANWTANSYSISYNANGGSGTMDATSVTYDTEVAIALNGFARENYVFKGWATEADGDVVYQPGESVVNLTAMADGVIVLYAVWEYVPRKFEITYENLHGATHENPSIYTEGSSVEFVDPSEVTGYTFAGWTPAQITADMIGMQTVRAEWTPNNYTISYDANGGAGSMAVTSATYDNGVTLRLNSFNRIGYKFVGWALNAEGSALYTDKDIVRNLTDVSDGNVVLFAKWMEDPIPELGVNASEADVVAALSGVADSALGANVKDAEKYGLFRKWALGKNIDLKSVKNSPNAWLSYLFDSDVLIDGAMTDGRLRIESFMPDIDSGIMGMKVRISDADIGAGATVENLLNAFAVEGTASLAEDFSVEKVAVEIGAPEDGAATLSVLPREDVNSFFVRTRLRDQVNGDRRNGCEVTFELNGGGSLSDGMSAKKFVEYASEYGDLPRPRREGYRFKGWYTSSEGGAKISSSTRLSILTSQTLYARWEVAGPEVQLWEGGPYWATTNVGAKEPWDYGYYFWWGDTIGYKWENDAWVASDGSSSGFLFTTDNTPTYGLIPFYLKDEGWVDSDYSISPEHDAAQVHLGGAWRMPTDDELGGLVSKCDWTLTTTNGVKGYIICGKGEYAYDSIFLPAAGYVNGTSLYAEATYAVYWSSIPLSDSEQSYRLVSMDENNRMIFRGPRNLGSTIRPVKSFTEFQ